MIIFPPNESERLKELLDYDILDTGAEAALDEIVQLANQLLSCPIAAISLVDSDRQWFKAKVGLEASQTSRDVAFCAHTICQNDIFVVPDAIADERFKTNPLVTQGLKIRFYAGAPLSTPSGANLGTLCVIDHVPRLFSSENEKILKALAKMVMIHFEMRKKTRQATLVINSSSDQQLKTIFGSMSEGLVVQDKDGKILQCNPSALRILGLSLDELLGRTSIDPRWRTIKKDGSPFLGEDHPAMVTLRTKKPLHGVEMGVHKKNGKFSWISINSLPIFDGVSELPYQVLTTFSDITKTKLDSSKLKKRKETIALERNKFEKLVFALNRTAMVLISDIRGKVLDANDKFCKISGYSLNELSEKKHPLLDDKYYDENIQKDMWLKLKAGEVWHQQAQFQHKDGTSYWANTTIVPMENKFGKINEIISIRFDITQQKEFESQLIEARKAEVSANKAKSAFLANMSHEIRTPLNGIIGMTQILMDTDLNPDQKNFGEAIVTSTKSLLSIINDVLDFSKIEAGKMVLETTEFDLNTSCLDILRTFEFVKINRQINLTHSFPDLDNLIVGDPVRLGQVLYNLIGNAVKFTEQGTISFVVSKVKENRKKLNIKFAVHDTGVGIEKEHIDRIFDAFTQGDVSTVRKFGGTGLGLSITSKLVSMMNGKIRLRSTPGKGTTFEFTLPFVKGAKLSGIAETKRKINTNAKMFSGRVLVVEDNQINQMVVQKLLEKLGCKSLVASNGIEAIESFKSVDFDLILMDCQMPEMDGYDATRHIRAIEKSHSDGENPIPIVALTANALKGDREKCLACGMNDYLSKPIGKQHLIDILLKYLPQSNLNSSEKQEKSA